MAALSKPIDIEEIDQGMKRSMAAVNVGTSVCLCIHTYICTPLFMPQCVALVVYLWLCASGCVPLVVYLWLCASGCVPLVVYLWLCASGCVPLVVYLWLCASGCVPLVVCLWLVVALFVVLCVVYAYCMLHVCVCNVWCHCA